jgi:ribosome-associated protein
MSGPLFLTPSVSIPDSELSVRFSRSSGPGGQGVNTTDSRVELSFDLDNSAALSGTLKDRARARLAGRLVRGVLTVAASEYRSQRRNRAAAEDRLAALMREALAPPPQPRKRTRPSRGAVERRLAGKRHRSQVKRLRRGVGEE